MICELAKRRLKKAKEKSREEKECQNCFKEGICPKCGGDLLILFPSRGSTHIRKKCKKCFTIHSYNY